MIYCHCIINSKHDRFDYIDSEFYNTEINKQLKYKVVFEIGYIKYETMFLIFL